MIGGDGETNGNVFVSNSDTYFGPVCSVGWGDKAATVVCRQLGFSRGVATVSTEFGLVPGVFAMTEVNCASGDEAVLQDCDYKINNDTTCSSTNGAGVRCFNKFGGGTCTKETEELLYSEKCHKEIAQLPRIIRKTIVEGLLKNSCNPDVGRVQDCYPDDCLFFKGERASDISNRKARRARKLKHSNKRRAKRNVENTRLTPIEEIEVFGSPNNVISPEINFEHTRHRYSWICSLRTKGTDPEHLCAVTLLSVPPQPTVVVGAAHCTFLCKDPRGFPLDSCCCSDAGLDCSDDTTKCEDNPSVFKVGIKLI